MVESLKSYEWLQVSLTFEIRKKPPCCGLKDYKESAD
jgi:hypothetical protein